MTFWASEAFRMLDTSGPVALVTVCVARGSVPRDAGTKMLVSHSATWGTIGGGQLEFRAIDQARKLLAQRERTRLLQDYPLGPLLHQCCGGHVTVLIETLDQDAKLWLAELDRERNSGGGRFLVTDLMAGSPQKTLLDRQEMLEIYDLDATDVMERPEKETAVLWMVPGTQRTGQRGHTAAAAKPYRYLIERIETCRPQVMLFGAGHVGQAIAQVLGVLEVDVSWIDSRPEAFPSQVPANLTKRVINNPVDEAEKADADNFFLVLTHSHDLDYALTATILKKNKVKYCGLIGSQTKKARFEKRLLREPGIGDEELRSLRCPIGLGQIKGKDPGAIAVAIAGEILTLLEADEP